MLILWPLLQPPRRRACFELSLLKTYVSLLRWRVRWSISINLGWNLAEWTPWYYSLRRISFLRKSQRLTKCEERLIGFGCPRTKSCTNALSLGHIFYAYTLRRQSYSWRSYIKGFVEVTQEVDLCLTELLLRDTGGQTCRRKHKSMWRSVTNAKNLHQTFTNQGESLILCPTLDHLLNGAWIS